MPPHDDAPELPHNVLSIRARLDQREAKAAELDERYGPDWPPRERRRYDAETMRTYAQLQENWHYIRQYDHPFVDGPGDPDDEPS